MLKIYYYISDYKQSNNCNFSLIMLFNDRYNKNGYGWVYKNYFLYIFLNLY